MRYGIQKYLSTVHAAGQKPKKSNHEVKGGDSLGNLWNIFAVKEF